MPRSYAPIAICLLLAACEARAPVAPRVVEGDGAARAAHPAYVGTEREVFSLADDGTGIVVAGVVPTAEARAVLLEEVERRWPDRPVRASVAIEPEAPALWVPEAVALMPVMAGLRDPGLVVRSRPGVAAGTLTLTGAVAEAGLARTIESDAAASVAPPFQVHARLAVSPADAAADSLALLEPTVSGLELVAAEVEALRRTVAGAVIGFQQGSAEPALESDAALDRIARFLVATESVGLEIAAPADGSGSSSLDRELAARRAGRLVEELRDRGIDSGRLRSASDRVAPTIEFTLVPSI